MLWDMGILQYSPGLAAKVCSTVCVVSSRCCSHASLHLLLTQGKSSAVWLPSRSHSCSAHPIRL